MTSLTTISKKTPLQRIAKKFLNDGYLLLNDGTGNGSRLVNRGSGQAQTISYISDVYQRQTYADYSESAAVEAYVKRTLPLVTGPVFLPNGPSIVHAYGSYWYNTYRPYVSATKCAAPHPFFFELFERLIPVEAEREINQDWFAHMFQKPQERPSVHLMWLSVEGTGKGFFVEHVLTPLLMGQTYVVKNYSQIFAQFSTMLAKSMLILLDDTKSKREDTMTQLKSLLTEERQYIEGKNQDGTMKPTVSRIILASNEDKPIPVDEGCRRWWAPLKMLHRHSPEETSQFIGKYAKVLEQPGELDKIYNWYMARDISKFNHKHIPQSEQLRIMIGLKSDSFDEFVADYLEDHRVLTLARLKTELIDAKIRFDDAKLVKALKDAGYKNDRLRLHGVRNRFWYHNSLTADDATKMLGDF